MARGSRSKSKGGRKGSVKKATSSMKPMMSNGGNKMMMSQCPGYKGGK